jgi:hypothetical protein
MSGGMLLERKPRLFRLEARLVRCTLKLLILGQR